MSSPSPDPARHDPAVPAAPEFSPEQLAAARKTLARDVALFSAARLGLVAVIAAAVVGLSALVNAQVPLVVAFLIALVAALPLSLVLFGALRRRVNEGIVVVGARRRSDKASLHARLGGDPGAPDADRDTPTSPAA